MESLLQACRDSLGPAPRAIPFRERSYFYPSLLSLDAGDQLNPLDKARPLLLQRGQVVWCAIVRTRAYMFEPGPVGAPALVVWSEDPAWENDPLAARVLALEVDALKVGSHTSEFMQIAGLLTSEKERPFNYRLPASMAPSAFLTSIVLFRRHLPCGFVSSGLLPLLVLPEETPFSMVLPGRYWPDALKDS
jgi:hypothetical protein